MRGALQFREFGRVGECASSGLHGANRMGSNSLLEGMVLGESAGRNAALQCETQSRHRPSRILAP